MGRRGWGVRVAFVCAVFAAPGCSDCGGGTKSGGVANGDAALDAGTGRCADGAAFACDGTVATTCAGDGAAPRDCADEGKSCDTELGCVDCSPGETTCADGKATYCRPNGSLARFACDPEQGMTCEASGCRGACALDQVDQSYIGCDYYPTMTLNPVWSGFAFAIAVANASDEPTRVLITGPGDYSRTETVAAHALQTFELPWVDALKGGDVACTMPPPVGETRVVTGGAYRVRSDHPITVYQFSPLEFELTGRDDCPVLAECGMGSTETRCLSYSNDASILLPATALTGNYAALAWPTQSAGAGFLAVTATEDDTQVTVHGAGTFVPGGGVTAQGPSTVTLARGDVLELVAASASDPSGTRIRATKPVQVLAGHSCAYVPEEGVDTCDHIEEALLPEDTLGAEYVVAVPRFADAQTDVPFVLRIAAVRDGTTVAFDPDVGETVQLAAGETFEKRFAGAALTHLRLTSNQPILVASYLTGYSALPDAVKNAGISDPSMSVAVPVEQYRKSYLFTAPTTYTSNLATIVLPEGAHLTLDGRTLDTSSAAPVGASTYRVLHVLLDDQTAVHTLDADTQVGLTVYGYGAYTSYMVPGGADLKRITIPVVL